MFSEMMHRIAMGLPVETSWLTPRLTLALVKKQGVIRLAPAMWPTDPKINPDSRHLLWAAVLLADRKMFLEVETVLTMELMEKAGTIRTGVIPDVESLVLAWLDALLQLAPDATYRAQLNANIHATLPSRYQYPPGAAPSHPCPPSLGSNAP